jgi:hypothetical protein
LDVRLRGVVVTIISVLALLGTLVGVYYARGQLREARRVREEDAKALARQHEAEREESEWANRYERLVSQLTKITLTMTVQPTGVPATQLYPSIFPDAKFREALQTYIVQLNASQTEFLRRPNPRPDELRLTNLRETIKRAEQCMAEFQRQNPKIDLNYYMGFHL